MPLSSCCCWIFALLLTGGLAYGLYKLATQAGSAALEKDKLSHLDMLNQARARSGKRPLTLQEFEAGRTETIDNPDVRRKHTPVEASHQEKPETSYTPASIVLLEREFREIEQPRLKALVEKAWGVEINDSTDDQSRERITYAGAPMGMISVGGYMFLFHNFPKPYFNLTEKEIEAVPEQRTRQAVRDSRSWRSVDFLGDPDAPDGPGRQAAYALLAKLAAELAGNGTLGLYFPELKRFFPYNDDTLRALGADDVLAELKKLHIEWVPVMSDDDTELIAAMDEARRRFGEFEDAFAERGPDGRPFAIKAAFSDGDHTEHMWVEVTAIEAGRVLGFLRSSPVNIRGLTQDQRVTVNVTDISDWIGVSNGKPIGNFTGPIIQKRHSQD